MQNRDLAAVFEEMADILEIKGDNPFRIRSFRRVAEALGSLNFSVAAAFPHEIAKVREVPGIGEGTIRKLTEILSTGRCQELEHLRSEIPASMLPMLRLQGLGPRRIQLIWQSLRIATLDELEAAARDHQLRSLPGMGEKTETTILKSIEEYRRQEGRHRLDQAMHTSQAVVQYLTSEPGIERWAVAGSVRRRRETIGDVDILVCSSSPAEARRRFLAYPGVRSVLASGETKASIVLSGGLQLDLRLVDPDCFGAALQYFTGSKEHNVAIRERAKRLGYKLSEYGVFRIADDAKLAGAEEESVYSLLGLQYIHPELRENRGEIEAAERSLLPRLIELDDIRGDLHMHSEASDGADSVAAMAEAGAAAGYEYIAITDHSKALSMIGGLDEDALLQHCEEIDRINAGCRDLTILKGIEVDILPDGSLDLRNEVLDQLDVVIASVHSRFSMNGPEMTRRVCRALENPRVNILAHPTGRLLLRREPYPVDLQEVFRVAVGNRVAVELNSYPDRLDLKDTHCRMAKDAGVLLSINTDSHSARMLGHIRYGVATARRGWITAADVINTRPIEELRQILRKEIYR
jgi:DNA polymerase (family X)